MNSHLCGPFTKHGTKVECANQPVFQTVNDLGFLYNGILYKADICFVIKDLGGNKVTNKNSEVQQ